MNHETLLLLFDPDTQKRAGPANYLRANQLSEQGFIVRHCPNVAQLRRHIQRKKPTGRGPAVAVLNGTHDANCAAASSLRSLEPAIGVVALVDSFNESVIIQTLQSGADNYCSRNASATLLATTLLQLQKRIQATNRTVVPVVSIVPIVPPPDPKNGQWILLDQAWKLVNPAGKVVFLTTGERAFMVTLFNAPGMRAMHADLVQAVHTGIRPDAAQSRLGVMVSRMRNKFRHEGVKLPLKSLHNWGYMFTEAGRFQDG